MKTNYFDDYKLGDYRTSAARTITEYFLPYFKTGQKAETSKGMMAHNALVFSIVTGIHSTENNPAISSCIYAKAQFLKPLYIGDAITSKLSIIKKCDHQKNNLGTVIETLEVFNQYQQLMMSCRRVLEVMRHQISPVVV
ncbi:MAG: hypothetical protein HRT88_20530 [Lentisphaeraceae bacterium]|nr:hypothetical protein [Lentisphaeraceae bacterium]